MMRDLHAVAGAVDLFLAIKCEVLYVFALSLARSDRVWPDSVRQESPRGGPSACAPAPARRSSISVLVP